MCACAVRVTVVVLCVCVCCPLHAILAVHTITSKTKDAIMLSIEFGTIIKVFFLEMSGSKVRALLLTSVRMAILS